jgi:hypothetical protein
VPNTDYLEAEYWSDYHLILLSEPDETDAKTFVDNGFTYEITSLPNRTCKVAALPEDATGDITIPSTASYLNRTFTVTGLKTGLIFNRTDITSLTLPETIASADEGAISLSTIETINVGSWAELANDCSMMIISCKIGKMNVGSESVPSFAMYSDFDEWILEPTIQSFSYPIANNNSVTDLTVSDGDDAISFYRQVSGCPRKLYLGRPLSTSTFFKKNALEELEVGGSVTTIAASAFAESGLKIVKLNSEALTIAKGAFQGCTSLTDVTMPGVVTSIGESAFEGCTALSNLELSESLNSIDRRAFYGCTSLETVALPEGVTAVPAYAFQSCSDCA